MMKNDEVVPWHSRVPPGVPGAAWLVATVFVFCVFTLTGWAGGWWETNRANIAAPHHTTGSGNRPPQ